MNLESLLAKVAHSKVIPPQASGCHWSAKVFKYNNNHYSNSNKRLGGTYQESCPLGVLELSTSMNLTSI